MPDTEKPSYSGLIVPHPSLALWEDQSTATQGGRRPGIPIPLRSTSMSLAAIGDFPEQDIEILTVRSGMPGLGGAAYVWRHSADPVELWRGFNTGPTIHENEQALTPGVPFGTVDAVRSMHLIEFRQTADLICAMQEQSSAPNPYGVSVILRDSESDEWSDPVRVYSQLDDPVDPLAPCLLQLPSGRVQLYHWIDNGQIRMHYSLDGGLTWALGQAEVLDDAVAGAGTRGSHLRVAVSGGTVVMFATWTEAGLAQESQILQWASTDEGVTFRGVVTLAGLDETLGGGGAIDVESIGGSAALVYLDAVNGYPHLKWVPNGFHDIQAIEGTEITATAWAAVDVNGAITLAEAAIVIDPAGRMRVFGRRSADVVVEQAESLDLGDTWSTTGGTVWHAGNLVPARYPRFLAATGSGGRACLIYGFDPTGATLGGGVSAMWLGGYSTAPLPSSIAPNRYVWTDTWIPVGLPEDLGWERLGNATAARAFTDTGLKLTNAAGSVEYYRQVITTQVPDLQQGMIVQCNVRIDAGGSASPLIGMNLLMEDYLLTIALQVDGTVQLLDNGVPIDSFSVGTVISDPGVELLIGVQQSALSVAAPVLARVWWRSLRTDADRDYALGSEVELSDVGIAVLKELNWGHLTAGVGDEVSTWSVAVQGTGAAAVGFVDQVNPDDITGHTYGVRAEWLDEGSYLSARSGPTLRGDEWLIAARYRFGLDRLRRASPRIAWRGEPVGDLHPPAESIAWQWSDTGNASIGADVLGIGLYNTNATRVRVELYDADGPGWVVIGDVDLGREGVGFAQAGGAVTPAAGGASTWLHEHELGEGFVALDDTAAGSRRVLYSREGAFSDDAAAGAVPPSVVTLRDVTGTEPAAGTSAAFYSGGGVILVLLDQAYQGVRLTLLGEAVGVAWPPPDATGDRRHFLGTPVIGPLHAFGHDYSWGRAVESSPTVESTTLRDGTEVHRVNAPPRRTVEFGWTDGIDQTQVEAGDAEPASWFRLSETGDAQVSPADTAYRFDGTVRMLNGPAQAVVYLPRVERLDTVLTVLSRRTEHVLATLTGPVRVEVIVGQENRDEAVRLASVTAREVI